MSSEIEALMSRIEPDPWRSKTGFSSEMQAALDVTMNSKSFEEIESALTAWIRKYLLVRTHRGKAVSDHLLPHHRRDALRR